MFLLGHTHNDTCTFVHSLTTLTNSSKDISSSLSSLYNSKRCKTVNHIMSRSFIILSLCQYIRPEALQRKEIRCIAIFFCKIFQKLRMGALSETDRSISERELPPRKKNQKRTKENHKQHFFSSSVASFQILAQHTSLTPIDVWYIYIFSKKALSNSPINWTTTTIEKSANKQTSISISISSSSI